MARPSPCAKYVDPGAQPIRSVAREGAGRGSGSPGVPSGRGMVGEASRSRAEAPPADRGPAPHSVTARPDPLRGPSDPSREERRGRWDRLQKGCWIVKRRDRRRISPDDRSLRGGRRTFSDKLGK